MCWMILIFRSSDKVQTTIIKRISSAWCPLLLINQTSHIMDIDYQAGEVELSYKSTVRKKRKIATSFDAYRMLLPTFREDTIGYKEYFKVVLLNQAQEVLGYTQISEGDQQ